MAIPIGEPSRGLVRSSPVILTPAEPSVMLWTLSTLDYHRERYIVPDETASVLQGVLTLAPNFTCYLNRL